MQVIHPMYSMLYTVNLGLCDCVGFSQIQSHIVAALYPSNLENRACMTFLKWDKQETMQNKCRFREVLKIHEDPRAWSLTDLENVCILYGHIGGVIVGLGYMLY